MVYMGSTAVHLEALSAHTAHSEDSMETPSEASVAYMEDWVAYMEAMASPSSEDTALSSVDLAHPSEVSV